MACFLTSITIIAENDVFVKTFLKFFFGDKKISEGDTLTYSKPNACRMALVVASSSPFTSVTSTLISLENPLV